MKPKLFIILAAVIVMIACNNDETFYSKCDEETITPPPLLEDDYYISYDSALSIAKRVISESMDKTRFNEGLKVKNHYEYTLSTQKRSIKGDSIEVKFHVINFANNQGYVMVSADSRTTPVYAYSDEGNLNMNSNHEDSGFKSFLESAEEYYCNEIRNNSNNKMLKVRFPDDPILPLPPDSDITSYVVVELDGVRYYSTSYTEHHSISPFVESNWSQISPYNYYYPYIDDADPYCDGKASAGCAPVAMGQIAAYYEYPNNYLGETITWDSLKYLPEYYSVDNYSKTVARFLYKIAENIHSTFGRVTTSTLSNVESGFTGLGYVYNGFVNFNSNLIYPSLIDRYPVLMKADNRYGNHNGHLWIIDGYNRYITHIIYYEMTFPYPKYLETVYGTTYYHCNWGNGYNNGYFLQTFVFDNDTEYNLNMKMMYNIRPINQE